MLRRTTIAAAITLAANLLASIGTNVPVNAAPALSPGDMLCRKTLYEGARQVMTNVARIETQCHRARVRTLATGTDCSTLSTVPNAELLALSASKNLVKRARSVCSAASPPASLGFETCPAPCESHTITDYASVASCLSCVAADRAGAVVEELYGTPPIPQTSDEVSCQNVIASEARYYLTRRMRQQKLCQQQHDLGTVTVDCRTADLTGAVAKQLAHVNKRLLKKCPDEVVGPLDSCGDTVAAEQACVAAALDTNVDALFDVVYNPFLVITATPTATPTPEPTPESTDVATATSAPAVTATPTGSASPEETGTPTETPTSADTPTPTATETVTETPTPADTPTPTETATETPAPEATATPEDPETETPAPEATATPEDPETETPTPEDTATPEDPETETPTPEDTPTATPTCGDGLVEGDEQCDDSNPDNGDGCDASCAVEVGYMCTGSPSICSGICGDGSVRAGESCDDGGTSDGDGCSATCSVEPGYDCTGEPSFCSLLCGNGTPDPDEDCDDGNSSPSDGCSSCTIDAGYQCSGTPSVCDGNCGDGLIRGSEECDDGHIDPGDGCSNLCLIESGFDCTGEPSVCVPF